MSLALLWGLPALLMLLTAAFAGGWILTLTWTVALGVMGATCLVNARGCGRTHCYFTGPFFLVMAIISLLHGTDRLPLGPQGWHYLGAAIAAGAVVLWVVPEALWGRYRRAPPDGHGC